MMLTFLGTRGNLDIASRRHRRHSATLVAYRGRRVMIDCGADWRCRVGRVRPDAIVLTHAHPDHAGGLTRDLPCPVYGTRATWDRVPAPVDRRTIAPGRPRRIEGIRFRAVPVEHSLIAPAVGYRITAGRATLFYVPDLAAFEDPDAALAGIGLYVGDGATLIRPLIRRRNGRRIGHAPIREQMEWCGAAGVPRAVFTHCGSAILTADERTLRARIRAFGREAGVEARLAYDGMRIRLP